MARERSGRAGRRGVALGAGLWGLALAALPAHAHPHVFIDTGLEIAFDDEGRAAIVQVVWVYDEFYSMMSIADYGLDPDFSGSLTEAERIELADIYGNWQPGYEGDLYPERGGAPLDLSPPYDFVADYREGRIIISHRRRFETPVAPDEVPLVIKVYDPTYYVAYTIAAAPQLRGVAGCRADVILPDFSYATEQLQAALDELMGGAGMGFDVEEDFPAVGADFAEEVHVTCAAPS